MTTPSSSWSSFEVLPDERYIPLLIIGSISSFLSMLGSGCVLLMSSRELHRFVMHRLMFALSLADLLSSTANLLMPWLIPTHLGLPAASGNHASCSAAGFFLMTFILVGCAYNAALSVYFMLVVCRNWKEIDFQQKRFPQELLMHILAWGIPLALNIVAATTQSINPSPLLNNLCVYATYPWTCNEDPTLECTRSTEATVSSMVTLGGIFLAVFTILGFVCTGMVWHYVRSTLERSSHYRFESDNTTSAADNNNPIVARILQVRTQAILYSLVYLNTFFWPFLATIFSNQMVHSAAEIQQIKLETGYYIFQILYFTFYPLQGFLNFFVYTRLRVQRKRKEDPNRSIWGIYKQIILTKSSVVNPQNQNQQHQQSNTKTKRSSKHSHDTNTQQQLQPQLQQPDAHESNDKRSEQRQETSPTPPQILTTTDSTSHQTFAEDSMIVVEANKQPPAAVAMPHPINVSTIQRQSHD